MINFKIQLEKFMHKFWSYMQLQLFITIASWPILIYWGLPISIASPLGNFIFAPFLTIFLLLSSLIFITEIIYFPNQYLIEILEIFNNFWQYIISFGSRSWLINFYKPNLIIALLIPLAAFAIVHNAKFIKTKVSTLMLFSLLILSSVTLKYQSANIEFIKEIECNSSHLTLIKSKEKNILIDAGALGSRVSTPNWVNFKLMSFFCQNGINNLDSLIIIKPSNTIFKCIYLICQKIDIKNIYIIDWSGELNNTGWLAWQNILEITKQNKINLFFINNKNYKISLNQNSYLEIIPENLINKKNKLIYQDTKININFLGQNLLIQTK